jgi:hypothetical protein
MLSTGASNQKNSERRLVTRITDFFASSERTCSHQTRPSWSSNLSQLARLFSSLFE